MRLLPRHFHVRLRFIDSGADRLHSGLIATRIYAKQHLSLLDQAPFLERHFGQPALDTGADFYDGSRLRPGCQFHHDWDLAALGGLNHHRRRRRLGGVQVPRPAATGSEEDRQRGEEQPRGAKCPESFHSSRSKPSVQRRSGYHLARRKRR